MQVSLSQAAKMVGVTRQTLYRHIDEKNISLIDKDTKRPKIDVSELVRIYGDKIKIPKEQDNNTPSSKSDHTQSDNKDALKVELELTREKVKSLELERERERRQLSDQIDNLQDMLKKEQEVVSKVTAQLTDQRSESEKRASKQDLQDEKLSKLEDTIKQLAESQTKKGWWIFGRK